MSILRCTRGRLRLNGGSSSRPLKEGEKTPQSSFLLKAFLITGNKGLLPQFIHDAYSGGPDKQNCAFRSTPGGPTLDISCQVVHTDVCKASDDLMKLLQQDQNQAAADQIRDRALQNLECSTARRSSSPLGVSGPPHTPDLSPLGDSLRWNDLS